MSFDAAPRPAVAGHTLFLPSSATDSVTAYDTRSGKKLWRFTMDGPVRFAPAVWQDRLYVVSDDGCLYCLSAEEGRLLWKFRGGPSGRMVLGNGRLVSTWPARGAPAVGEGVVYFAAGIWPFMGIFLHALDARTGTVLWSNDGDGSIYVKQPHNAESFGGVAPQGTLQIAGERLLVAGGRSVPACFDRRTGRLLYYRLADFPKIGGGSEVMAGKSTFLNGGVVFDLATGDALGLVGQPAVLAGDMVYGCSQKEVRAYDLTKARKQGVTTFLPKGLTLSIVSVLPGQIGTAAASGVETLLQAGSYLYAGKDGEVCAWDVPLSKKGQAMAWRAPLEGRPVHLVAGDGRLFVSTREGRLYCFGSAAISPNIISQKTTPLAPSNEWKTRAAEILALSGVHEGYCVVWGAGSGGLVRELARQNRLRIIVVEPDAGRAATLREELTAAGVYGEQVSLIHRHPSKVELPPYLASLMASEDLGEAGVTDIPAFAQRALLSLRPFGGTACLPVPRGALVELVANESKLNQVQVREAGAWTLLTRPGPLPGSADWTHEHADAANTRMSRDQLVKAPLGLLWFGGSSNESILPRHGHGPQPQVLDGRLFIEGMNMIRCMDIYTGRILWETRLADVGGPYDNTRHQPGANAGGGNFVTTREALYVAYGDRCVRLKPATGERLADLRLPRLAGFEGLPRWEYINVSDQYLVAGVNAARPPSLQRKTGPASSSQQLVVMDRSNGSVLWTATARQGFRHNTICIGGGRLYAVDRRPYEGALRPGVREKRTTTPARLIALALRNGQELWSTTAEVFGTWLSYSTVHDVLVESGRVTRDALPDEPVGMRAYRGRDGHVLWDEEDYDGPAIIHGEKILMDGCACDLRTGAPTTRTDPLTGRLTPWTWTRTHGCNTPEASEHLLTFRSGAAGYFDLCRDSGTGNFGGFRSGCSNNLVVAGGVISVPEYTRTCVCNYQNQASVGLVPLPGGEMWTNLHLQRVKGPIRRVGINLGAPGARKSSDDTLWLPHPAISSRMRTVPVLIEPTGVEWFRRHESQIAGEGWPWVAASGARGVRSVRITLAEDKAAERLYTVRLTFVEPDRILPGQRVFDVALQGQTVLQALDVCRAAGGPWRGLVREYRGVKVAKDLIITFTPHSSKDRGPVLCGVAVIAEGW
jgi:outer membrane protein assembly factor BamB